MHSTGVASFWAQDYSACIGLGEYMGGLLLLWSHGLDTLNNDNLFAQVLGSCDIEANHVIQRVHPSSSQFKGRGESVRCARMGLIITASVIKFRSMLTRRGSDRLSCCPLPGSNHDVVDRNFHPETTRNWPAPHQIQSAFQVIGSMRILQETTNRYLGPR
jgi:hypothetical protein